MQRAVDVDTQGLPPAPYPEAPATPSSLAASPTTTENLFETEASNDEQQAQNPPPYAPSNLRCITPAATTRYDKKALPWEHLPRHHEIPDGLHAYKDPGLPPAPEGWLELHHPEGQSYWHHPEGRVVTEANMRIPMICRMIIGWMNQIRSLLNINGIILQPSTELMLQPDEDNETCGYYLVDHARATIFWIESTTTIAQDLPPVTSITHLKLLLRQHYYTHLEYFSMHITLPASVQDELVAILTHACVDAMTSDLSTVPYSPAQCRQFLKLLNGIPESDSVEGYRNCVIGRLYSEIYANYFVNLRGEPNARLSRTQRLLPDPEIKTPRWIEFVNYSMWKSPAKHHQTLRELWVDKVSYSHHWDHYMKHLAYEWKYSASWSAVVTLCAILLQQLSPSSNDASTIIIWIISICNSAAILFGISSLVCGVILAHIHRSHTEVPAASETVEYLERAWHEEFGLQPLAILFSLPWSLLIWSLVCLGIRIVTSAFASSATIVECVSLVLSGALITLIYSILVLLKKAPNPIIKCHRIWRHLTEIIRRTRRQVLTFFRGGGDANDEAGGGWGCFQFSLPRWNRDRPRVSDYSPI